MRLMKWTRSLAAMASVVTALLTNSPGWSASEAPLCLSSNGTPLAINNDQVLDWKESTPNQFKERARVFGHVVDILPLRNEHDHFIIQLDKDPESILEVVYNRHFGELPEVKLGMEVEACGDYITSNAPYQRYPASPAGALIHWIHRSTRPKKHPHGYLILDGTVYGQTPDGRSEDGLH